MDTGYASVTAEERERLIIDHLPQVRWIAGCIHERLPASVSEEDLVSAGVIGLIAALDNFDASLNVSLRTYAEHRIRGAILDSIRGLDGIPAHKRKRLRLLQGALSTLEQRLMRPAEEAEVAEELGLPLDEYYEWLQELRGVTLGSLDSVKSEGADTGLLHYLADDRIEPATELLEREQLRRILAEGVAAMPAVEQAVLDLYFRQELTLAEIGRIMELHTSRISQLKTQAILRLRSWMTTRLRSRKAANG